MRTIIPLLCIVLGGCTYHASLAPLCTKEDAFRDNRLIGEWQLHKIPREEDRRPSFSVRFSEPASIVVSREAASTYQFVIGGGGRQIMFSCRIANMGEYQFLDLQRVSTDERIKGVGIVRPHLFLRCVISDTEIRLIDTTAPAFRAVLDDHHLPLSEIDSIVLFTGTTQQLAHILETHGAELYASGKRDIILRRKSE